MEVKHFAMERIAERNEEIAAAIRSIVRDQDTLKHVIVQRLGHPVESFHIGI